MLSLSLFSWIEELNLSCNRYAPYTWKLERDITTTQVKELQVGKLAQTGFLLTYCASPDFAWTPCSYQSWEAGTLFSVPLCQVAIGNSQAVSGSAVKTECLSAVCVTNMHFWWCRQLERILELVGSGQPLWPFLASAYCPDCRQINHGGLPAHGGGVLKREDTVYPLSFVSVNLGAQMFIGLFQPTCFRRDCLGYGGKWWPLLFKEKSWTRETASAPMCSGVELTLGYTAYSRPDPSP